MAVQVYILTSSERGFLFPPTIPLTFIVNFLLMIAIVIGMGWYLIVVMITISLIAGEVKHFFIYLLASYMSPWESVCSGSLFIF